MNNIKTKIVAFLAKFFPQLFNLTPTVAAVVADFNKVVKALEEVTAHHTTVAEVKAEAIRLAHIALADAYVEVAKARTIADKVRNLISA